MNVPPYGGGPWGQHPQPHYQPPRKAPVLWIVIGGVLALAAMIGLAVFGLRSLQAKRDAAQRAREDGERKVLPTSDYDATEDFVDEDFKLKVKWPGKGAKILRQAESSRLTPDSLATIMLVGGCQVIVAGDYNPGADLMRVAKATQDVMPGVKLHSSPVSARTFHGRPAAHFTLRTNFEGLEWEHDTVLIERDGWFLRFTGLRQTAAKCVVPSVESVTELLPGEVKGRNLSASSDDHSVPQYRLQGRTFESLAHQFRLRPVPDTSLLVGELLAEQDRESAALVSRVGLAAWISSTPKPPVSLAEYRAELERTYRDGQTKVEKLAVVSAKAGSGADALILGHDTGEVLWFAELVGERLISYRIVHSPSLRKQATALLAELREHLEPLGAAELAELQKVLPTEDPTRRVGVDLSLRASTLVEYSTGFTLKMPRITNQPALRDPRAPELSLAFARPDSGVETTVWTFAAGDERVQRDRIAQTLTEVPVASLNRADQPALSGRARTAYDYSLGGLPARLEIVTIPGKSGRHYVVTTGLTAWVDGAESVTHEMVRSIAEPGPIAESTTGARSIENRRFGFSLELPAGDWTIHQPKESAGPMVVYQATTKNAEVGLVGVAIDGARAEVSAEMVEQQLVAVVAGGMTVPERSAGRLGSIPGRRLAVSSTVDAIVARAGGSVFILTVESKGVNKLDPVAVYAGFSLVD